MSSSNLMHKLNNLTGKTIANKVESKLLAICPVTGISLQIEAPSIHPLVLEYTNPLAEARNFLKIAELPTSELVKFEPVILAGILLAIWRHYDLLHCPMTATAQNSSLQSIHPATLVSTIKFFSRVNSRNCKFLGNVTLVPPSVEVARLSSVSSVVKDFVEVCRAIIDPAQTNEEAKIDSLEKEADSVYNYRKLASDAQKKLEQSRRMKKRAAIQKDLLSEGKRLTKELKAENILSPRLVQFLEALFKDSYLLSAEIEVKDRISKALLKHSNPKAQRLVQVINNATSEEIEVIFRREEDAEVYDKLEQVEEEQQVKLSMKEILELRKAGLPVPASKTSPSIPSIAEQVAEHFEEEAEEEEEIEEAEELEEIEELEGASNE